MDLSKLSDEDLQALSVGDVTKLSDGGLAILSGQPAKRKTTLGEDLGIAAGQAASTVVRGGGLIAGGLASYLDRDIGDKIFQKSGEIAKETTDYWTPQDAEQSFGGKLTGMVGTFPLQMAGMIASPADTGRTFIDNGETVDKARVATGIDTVGNMVGLGLPGALPGNLLKRMASGAGINAAQDVVTRQMISDVANQEETKKQFAPTLETTGLAAAMGVGIGMLPSAKNVEIKKGDGGYGSKDVKPDPVPTYDFRKDAEGQIVTIDARLEAITNQLARQTNMDSEYSLKLQDEARQLQNQRIQLELGLGKQEISMGKTQSDQATTKTTEETATLPKNSIGESIEVGGSDPHTVVYTHLEDGRLRRKVTYPDGTTFEETLMTTKDGDHVWVSDEQYSRGTYFPEQLTREYAEGWVKNEHKSEETQPNAVESTTPRRPEFEPKATKAEVNEEVMKKDYSQMPFKYIEKAWEIKSNKLREVTDALYEVGLGTESGQRLLVFRDILAQELEHIEAAMAKRNQAIDKNQVAQTDRLHQTYGPEYPLANELRAAVEQGGLLGGLKFIADNVTNPILTQYKKSYGLLAKALLNNPLINAVVRLDPNFKENGGYDNVHGDIYLRDHGSPEVLLHEAIHSAVNKAIVMFEKGIQLPARTEYAAKQIVDLFNRIKKTPELWNKVVRTLGEENANIFFENPREFVSYGTTNISLMTTLQQMRLGSTSVWSPLTNAFKNLLGLNKNERTAFDDVLRYTEQLIELSDGKALGFDPNGQPISFARRPKSVSEIAQGIRFGADWVFAHGFTQNLPQFMRKDPQFTALEKSIREADIYREKVAREAGFGKETQQDYNNKNKVLFKLSATEDPNALIPAMQKISNKDLATTMNTLVDGMRKGQDIATTITQNQGWKPEQVRVAQAMERSVNVLWEGAIKMLGKSNLDPSLKQRLGYILMSRSGDHVITVSLNGVPIRYESYMTPKEAQQRADWFKQQSNGKVDIAVGNKKDLGEASAHDNLIEFLEGSMSLPKGDIAKHVSDTLDRLTRENSAIGSHSRVSSVLAGFAGDQAGISLEKSGALWRDSIPRAINEYAQSIMNREVTKKLIEWHVDNDGKMSQHVADIGDFYAKTQMGKFFDEDTFRGKLRETSAAFKERISEAADSVFGTELRDIHAFDRFMGVFSSAFYIANITMKPAIWIAQPLQALHSVRSAFKNGEGAWQVASAFGNAMKVITSGKMFADKDFMNALYHVSQEGNTLHPQMMNEFNEIKFGHDPNTWYNKMFQVANGQMISAAGDKFSRFASFAFFYHLHKQSGLTGTELYNKAAQDTTDNMVGYGSKKMPAIYREMGLFGEQGSPLATFAHTQAGNLIVDVKEFVSGWKQSFDQRKLEPGFRNTAPLVMTSIIMMATGGAISLPLLAEYELLRLAGIQSGWWGSQWPNVRDIINKFAPTWVSHGVLSDVTGIDMDASMRYTSLIKGIGSVQEYGLGTFMPHLGWGWNAIKSVPDLVGGVTGTSTQGEVDMALKKVVPKGWPSGAVDYLRNDGEKYTRSGPKGTALVERNTPEALASWVGSRSTNESISMEAHLVKQQRDEQQKKLINRAAQFFSQGNKEQGLKLYNRLLTDHYNGDRNKLSQAIERQIAAENLPLAIRDYVSPEGSMSEDNQRAFIRDNQANLLQKMRRN